MNEKGLGLRIGEARRKAHLTQQELCQKTGLSYSTLAKIERGAIKSPSIFTIQQISEALGESIDAIIGTDSAKTAKPAKKRSKNGIEFVYFDIHGCLVRFFHRAFTQAAHDTGVSPDVVESTYWHYNDLACRGEITMVELNQTLAGKFGAKEFDWEKYYIKAVESVPAMSELMDWATEHYRVGLLSNIMPGFIDMLIERKLIPKKEYDAIVDSSVVGAIKPEKKIYEIATQKTQVPADSILLVDDSRTNLVAAEKFGWKVLWFDDYRPSESIKRVRQTLEF
jgi:FMN phosphatase YigB (HAD superfamily)/DNA-binding XRE family transcriptional regulator